MMQQAQIAAVIERDLLRADDGKPSADTTRCSSCGYSMIARKGRFCSDRCRSWFDAGNPSYEEQCEHQRALENAPLRGFVAVAGPPGTVGTNPWQSILDASGGGTPILRRGAHGFYIHCAGCQKEFESRGLRCCSAACERRYRERQDNLAVMAEAGIEPAAKRRCECGAVIPKWRNGRRVSSATRFCSPKCSRKARRASDSGNAPLKLETMKKCP